MVAEMIIKEAIEIKNAPNIPGLIFRGFHGEEDYPHMIEIFEATREEDKTEATVSIEDVARNYSHLERCDPLKDMLFAEVDGEVIAYSRCMWDEELEGDYLYSHFVNIKPNWRGKGIGKAISRHQQERLREIANEHPTDAPKFFQGWGSDTQKWQIQLYTEQGFEPVRYGLELIRLCSEPMTPTHLPKGVEARPATKEHIRQIWDAQAEAFQDHWGFVPPTEENFKHWQEEPTFQPEHWYIAWEGKEVVGMVLNYINHEENKEYNRQRGYTENISVRRPWRRQGVARSLLTQSIKMFQEMGMEKTCLGVDTQNPHNAMRLYKSVGYKETKRFTTFRKPME